MFGIQGLVCMQSTLDLFTRHVWATHAVAGHGTSIQCCNKQARKAGLWLIFKTSRNPGTCCSWNLHFISGAFARVGGCIDMFGAWHAHCLGSCRTMLMYCLALDLAEQQGFGGNLQARDSLWPSTPWTAAPLWTPTSLWAPSLASTLATSSWARLAVTR